MDHKICKTCSGKNYSVYKNCANCRKEWREDKAVSRQSNKYIAANLLKQCLPYIEQDRLIGAGVVLHAKNMGIPYDRHQADLQKTIDLQNEIKQFLDNQNDT